jgi:hypothetical protein
MGVPPLNLQLEGTPKGEVHTFTYKWSPSIAIKRAEFGANFGTRIFIPVGTIEVQSVSDLRFTTPAVAQAKFHWKLNQNKAGMAAVPNTISQIGNASFAKEPDGVWVVAGASLSAGMQ